MNIGKIVFPVVRNGAVIVAAATLAFSGPACNAESLQRWDFDKSNDRQGWTIPEDARGVVMGGSLWLRLVPKEKDPAKILEPMYQVFGDMGEGNAVNPEFGIEIVSPRGLGFAALDGRNAQVRMKVLNLSPVTDLFLRWRTKEQTTGWGLLEGAEGGFKQYTQSRHCALESDVKEWQEITCFLASQWHGAIDQIGIYVPQNIRGDIWFASVELVNGLPEPVLPRPDVASVAVIPKVSIPGISQAGFTKAFRVLDENLMMDVPRLGFTHPFMSAGGYYNSTQSWWPMDTSLAVCGAKWANQGFAESVMRGFHDVQAENPDGRFDLWGRSAVRGQVGDVSQIPRIFEVAYDVARRTNDLQLRSEIYQTMQRYLDWWLSPVKRDSRTGLVSGVLEETQGAPEVEAPLSVAPVDLNVAVAVGAARTAALAGSLGKAGDSKKYRQVFEDLSHAINSTLWDEHDGVYYNYDLRAGHTQKRLIVSTFNPLRLGIVPPARRDRLLKRMIDPTQFNWGKLPLTGLAMTEPDYAEAKGHFGDQSWFGDVWTELNLPIIAGLEESGRSDLAAELNWATIKAFHNNYREYLVPSTGEGQGAKDYTWSASQYIAAIVEHLFGVDFDAIRKQIRIAPNVPQELYGQDITLDDLILPAPQNTRLSVHINQSSATAATIRVNISGKLPKGDLLLMLPGAEKEKRMSMRRSFIAKFQ